MVPFTKEVFVTLSLYFGPMLSALENETDDGLFHVPPRS